MVFDKLYTADFLLKRPSFAFILGIAHTILGLFLAILIFRDSPALIAVGITSLLLMPSLFKITSKTEIIQTKANNFWNVLKSNLPVVKVYIFMFFGIFFTFAFFSMVLPELARNHLFSQQLAIILGSGQATFSMGLFWHLFSWNLQVLLLCMIISLIAGNGAILFIAWNASVWGTIFGNLAKTAAVVSGGSIAIIFLLIIISVFPHTFLEGLSYIVSTISGTLMSDGLAKEKFFSRKMGRVFKYNALIFLLAIAILVVACAVETFVLNNFETYHLIIQIAFGG